MNQKFRDKYNQLRENDPSPSEGKEEHAKENNDQDSDENLYAHPGNTRNLGFVWPDGRRMFLNYAYLISGELTLEGETNILTLQFTSRVVKLRGYKLDTLYSEIFVQRTRIISSAKRRYANLESEESLVTEIDIISENKV